MNPQTRLIEVTGSGYPSRDCKIHDCCDRCLHLESCTLLMRRCFPKGELREQCEACKPCKAFVERPESPFATAYDILHGGPIV